MAEVTVTPGENEEEVVVRIPADCYVWSINPRGDATFITIKKESDR